MKIKVIKNCFALGSFFLLVMVSPGWSADSKTLAGQLIEEADGLDDAWLDQKKEFLKKYEDLIKRIGEGIEERTSALDHGDPKRREEINKEKAQLERRRNKLKRKLGEFTAAKTVDFSHIKENISDKIKDMKGENVV